MPYIVRIEQKKKDLDNSLYMFSFSFSDFLFITSLGYKTLLSLIAWTLWFLRHKFTIPYYKHLLACLYTSLDLGNTGLLPPYSVSPAGPPRSSALSNE